MQTYEESSLRARLEELLASPAETEVVEFKEAKNGYDFGKLGKYFSALSNEANLKRRRDAWVVFGIRDADHAIVGSQFRPDPAHLHSLKKEIAQKTTGNVSFIEIYELATDGGRVVLFQIPPAPPGMPIAWEGHYYGRHGDELGALSMPELEAIRNQRPRDDWSAGLLTGVGLENLDDAALQLARSNYIIKNPRLADEVKGWDLETFLRKTKLMVNGQLTRAAIILLGSPEAEYHLSPAVCRITWVLKDKDGIEEDYEHFTCPMISAMDAVFAKIRNLKYRFLKDETLFPEEVQRYEPQNIREALANCIAHQDYTLGGRINVVESEDGYLSFTNLGSFLPGSIKQVIKADSPPEYYRNALLCDAMRNFNMIDTIGSGIKRMFRLQSKRLFPMPDYDLSDGKVKATLIGKVLDIDYATILLRDPSLSLEEIMLLDNVQKKKPIADDEAELLRKRGLIEGRKPNYILSASLAQKMGQKAAYTRLKAFKNEDYAEWIIQGIKDHGSLTRKEVDELLAGRFSDLLTPKQIKEKTSSILKMLRQAGTIRNEGSDAKPKWVFNT